MFPSQPRRPCVNLQIGDDILLIIAGFAAKGTIQRDNNHVLALLAKMGNISMTTTVQSVETGTLAADMFAVPADYKLKEQK